MRFVIAATLAFAIVQAQSAAAASSQTCAVVSEADIAKLFDRWNDSLATLNATEVAKNYADDAILLPTLSNKPRLTQAERIDYFAHFLENHPRGNVDSRVIKIGCNSAVDAGTYTFTFKDGSQVPARYTYTYEYKNGTWLISSHHSSMMPEKALAH
ncbi:hypothetical protein AA309_24405 [Microvirga vignae]|uniref:Calcium/calmodulin-dependent protein kinase II association-domain domain-containing protein n=1 Tax=Microvirga vignae TaxID=1225564 RepID=A0A0H1R6H4_9HYPH|nr:SgcJ/EcaC family oxidoreductase [Microvirga vignae]KLK90654.1 hypothetical protein AA309_24405 [Microvirga vignae]